VSGAEKPLWCDIEDGAGNINVARIPFPGGSVTKYSQLIEALMDIETQDHGFKTLVIDTIDRLESLVWDHVCAKAGAKYKTIEDFGYGKGYVVALQCWRDFAQKLDQIRLKRGMQIVLIAHSQIKTFRNPEGDDYDRYVLRLHDKAAGFIKEWADVVAFMRFDESASKLQGDTKAKGYTTGKRHIHTNRRAAFDAKTRISIGDQIVVEGAKSWPLLTERKLKTEENNPF